MLAAPAPRSRENNDEPRNSEGRDWHSRYGAVIDARAELHGDVMIGPHVMIHGPARLQRGTCVGPHVTIMGVTEIGPNCEIHSHACIGGAPRTGRTRARSRFVGLGPARSCVKA